jgi:hypothetical protein
MRSFKTIRGGQGIGDALYVQAVARHYVAKGTKLRVATSWPEIFKPLGVEIIPFTRQGIDILAHYSMRKRYKETTQFKDVCLQAGITENIDLKIDWKITNPELVKSLKTDKKLCIVQMPRNPMGRTDGFGKELLPDCKVIQGIINALKSTYTIAQIGAGEAIYKFEGVDIDLSNKTSVNELLDIASEADMFLGYCSFVIPLAESFDKPALIVWSSKGLRSVDPYIHTITPEKILHKQSSKFVIDNWEHQKITDIVNEFLR